MTGVRRFSLSSPDWGQDHLSLDAVVAYVDDELTEGARHRADAHLGSCPGCRAEVVAQRQARAALRAAGGPRLPSSLLHTLRCIPVEAELPPPPPGLGITADGQFVLLRDVPDTAAHPDGAPVPVTVRRSSRRARFGAVSGLAIGALAVGALAVPTSAPPPPQGVLGDAVRNGAVRQDTAARLGPATTVSAPVPVVGSTSPGPASAAAIPDSSTPDASAADSGAVLDPSVRRRLDRAPVVFYRSP